MNATLIQAILTDLCKSFKNKIDDQYQLVAQFNITDLEQSWAVIIQPGKKMSLQNGPHEKAMCFFRAEAETLRKIYAGDLTALTAAGKGGAEAPLLQVSLARGVNAQKARNQIFSFLQRFFNKTFPEKVVLAEKHARKINGGHSIPLYSSAAQRSVWHLLKNGDRLNDSRQGNPFPQSLIFVQGQGFAVIGEDTVKVKAGESYFVPPKSEHVVWNESKEPLVVISLAWNDAA